MNAFAGAAAYNAKHVTVCGGTYYSAVGHVPWEVIAASIPYGLLCTAVLMGKHVDKLPWDEREGIRTLPVMSTSIGSFGR